jgi:Cys-tRNA(Pro)/Cys-tRNA(Cys) deacylase
LAEQLGDEGGSVFKTLVLRGDKNGPFVCVVPGGAELDLKKAAGASGNKHCGLIPMKELFPLTGYVRGGCSPLGMKKRFPTYLDESALLWEAIHVSAGQRGLQLRIAPGDLAERAEAAVCDLCAG